MAVPTKDVQKLLLALAENCGQLLDRQGFDKMAEWINRGQEDDIITARYLYENLWLRVEKAIQGGESNLRIHLNKLNPIAIALGYRSFYHFGEIHGSTISEQLLSCVGTYYSYSRDNHSPEHILISPVRIYVENGILFFEMRGKHRSFIGEVKFLNGCLFALLVAENEKSLHVNFRLGIARSPRLLRGVFSGMSSAGDPICGPEILCKEEKEEWEEMGNWRVSLRKSEASDPFIDPRLKNFFINNKDLYIKIKGGGSFTLDDLE